jgi:hypothetical protein
LVSFSLKHSFLLVNYHDFTLMIGPIAVAENNIESHGSVGEGREGGAVGQLFPETELPIGGLQWFHTRDWPNCSCREEC